MKGPLSEYRKLFLTSNLLEVNVIVRELDDDFRVKLFN